MSINVAKGQLIQPALPPFSKLISANALRVNGLVALCLGIVFTISDAFNTSNLGFSHRLSLWMVFSLLLVVQLFVFHRALLIKLAISKMSRAMAVVIAIILTSLFMTIELHWLKFTPLLPKEPDPFLEFFIFIAQPVTALSLLILLSQASSIGQYIQHIQETDTFNDGEDKRIGELFDISKTQKIYHIFAHDHYLEIQCENQKFFVRGRIKDAVEHLSESNGIQVHRSHWVAKESIQKLFRSGRDLKILLKDGVEVPVGRSKTGLVTGLKALTSQPPSTGSS